MEPRACAFSGEFYCWLFVVSSNGESCRRENIINLATKEDFQKRNVLAVAATLQHSAVEVEEEEEEEEVRKRCMFKVHV